MGTGEASEWRRRDSILLLQLAKAVKVGQIAKIGGKRKRGRKKEKKGFFFLVLHPIASSARLLFPPMALQTVRRGLFVSTIYVHTACERVYNWLEAEEEEQRGFLERKRT